MAMVGLDHVGIVVADLEAALARYRTVLGRAPDGVEDYGDGLLRIAFVPLAPDLPTALELLQPLRPGSSAWDFLAAHGEGIEHVAVAVDDLPGELARLGQVPGTLGDACPRPGARSSTIAFLRPDALPGVWLELVSGPLWVTGAERG